MIEENIPDEKLVGRVQQGDYEAQDELITRYTEYIKKVTASYYLLGFENEDLFQEGVISFIKAIETYNCNVNGSFKAYATTCIKNRILTLITQSQSHKNKALDQSVPFENLVLVSDDGLDNNIQTQMLIDDILSYINCSASKLEKNVFKLFLQGYSYSEISENLLIDEKSVGRAIYRLRKKIKSQYNDKD